MRYTFTACFILIFYFANGLSSAHEAEIIISGALPNSMTVEKMTARRRNKICFFMTDAMVKKELLEYTRNGEKQG